MSGDSMRKDYGQGPRAHQEQKNPCRASSDGHHFESKNRLHTDVVSSAHLQLPRISRRVLAPVTAGKLYRVLTLSLNTPDGRRRQNA